jgi:UDP-N-acetyl-D-glucosamine dehydrogenase
MNDVNESRRERKKPVIEMMTAPNLGKKLETKDARIAVIGLGYVGLPLATALAQSGFCVTGLDMDGRKVDAVMRGECYIDDIEAGVLAEQVDAGRLDATTDTAALAHVDVAIICVPTPYTKAKQPDLTYVKSAAEAIQRNVHPGMLIILESTTYPGTTREVLLPRLESTGLVSGEDFELAFSPERVDPGNKRFGLRNTPKIVGGLTPRATMMAAALYASVAERVVPVSTPEVAEMAKLMENTFRHVNIALANEMAILCRNMGIDIWEVIDAAATKPFGFMPFYPGPGVGGHCIPIDPYYFAWKVQEEEGFARFIQLAGEINDEMPQVVVTRIADALNDCGKSVKNSRVLVLGIAYKKDISDIRESPALRVIDRLQKKGARVAYHDPFVDELASREGTLASVALTPRELKEADCVVILTDHTSLPYDAIVDHAPLIIDTRNALKGRVARQLVRL